jgi:hypothetical protein
MRSHSIIQKILVFFLILSNYPALQTFESDYYEGYSMTDEQEPDYFQAKHLEQKLFYSNKTYCYVNGEQVGEYPGVYVN